MFKDFQRFVCLKSALEVRKYYIDTVSTVLMAVTQRDMIVVVVSSKNKIRRFQGSSLLLKLHQSAGAQCRF